MGALSILVTSAFVGATRSARAGVSAAELAARRTPPLVLLGLRATLGNGPATAEAAFRDELLTLFDDLGEIASRQARGARDDLGERTSPRDAVAAQGASPRRRHRVKA